MFRHCTAYPNYGVGKTSLVQRYIKGTFTPSTTASTVGASFLTKRVLDVDSGTLVRLQLWDTAGQERFRSISKLYYRGASAIVLVYSIVDEKSFQEMGRWMQEVKENTSDDIVVHVVGTKSDVVAQDPSRRMVPFERCIAYVAENLFPNQTSISPSAASGTNGVYSLDSKRSSGFWGQDHGWDCCHEISARDGEGIDEVFRVITRKLVEGKVKRAELEQGREASTTLGNERWQAGYFDGPGSDGHGSFRVGTVLLEVRLKSYQNMLPTVRGTAVFKGCDAISHEAVNGLEPYKEACGPPNSSLPAHPFVTLLLHFFRDYDFGHPKAMT
ncbi:MAG: hypothetical protein Q9182_004569 [Xanthomendoza sp. 2 TL-2023]